MKTTKIGACCVCLIFIAASIQARANQEYDWIGGAVGYSGSIILNSNSNSGGSLTDIVSAKITTPDGVFDYVPSSAHLYDPTFTWNPYQITEMDVGWTYFSSTHQAYFVAMAENINGYGTNAIQSRPPPPYPTIGDTSGQWLATPVPDGAPTLALLGSAILGFVSLRRRFSS